MCRHHPGEQLKLWCLTCEHTICAFCLLGTHQGHNAKDIDGVASRERDLLIRCEAVLQRTIEQRQRDLADLEKMKGHYNALVRDSVKELTISVEDMKGLLDSQHKHILKQIEGRETNMAGTLASFTSPLQEEVCRQIWN